ncbi:hypothetical protein HYALB_00013057 [Hymenoscyphus albidus]|uniref:AAA+ ATPase domain-containing protein n=1 Tax=Hymenoscyphus albidus TaxID=595503 RepID=A0A9N9QAA3_9HELO|nr:hypothetical protein HYALB_00013057 [Hymenoscyphus albidus]
MSDITRNESSVKYTDKGSQTQSLNEGGGGINAVTSTSSIPAPGREGRNEPWIRYTLERRDEGNEVKSRSIIHSDYATFNDALSNGDSVPVFERIMVHSTERTGNDQWSGGIPSYLIRIFSAPVMHALRSVVRYYPEQDLSGDDIEIGWPYPILVHHYEELRLYQKEVAEQNPEDTCVNKRYADKHLALLLSFLDSEVMEKVNAEKERNKRGVATFDYLWVALKPGTTIHFEMKESVEKGELYGGVISSIEAGIFVQRDWELKYWSIDYNGLLLGRVQRTGRTFHSFDGEAHMEESLKIKVLGNVDDFQKFVANESIKNAIAEGRMYWELLQKQCKHHDGTVMVDLNAFYSQQRRAQGATTGCRFISTVAGIPSLMGSFHQQGFLSECFCPICKSKLGRDTSKTPIFTDYTKVSRSEFPKLRDHRYFLCPKHIHVFVFKTRRWGNSKSVLRICLERVKVKKLSEPRFQPNMIDHLVMNEARLRTIKSLAGSFARIDNNGKALIENPWAADYIDGKGTGLIFLLHGGPGMGKTYTAECIANFLKKPLMVLKTTDIGTSTEDIESNLSRSFEMANSWGAVLLIDEADVFLANRTIEDLHRSSLVASFLRALEFFDGILFLTTNRVGTLDDAILSRVHVQLFYPDLDNEQRLTIWNNFIKKLEIEKPSMQVKYAVKEYLRSKEMQDFEMNGREIRNAFQTAVSLAQHRAEHGESGKTLLTEEHVRKVVELSKSFKHYFSELHGGPEGYRAFTRAERLDG